MIVIKYVIVLVLLLAVAAAFRWAFLPARYLPGHRAGHIRVRLHLRLHPGRGFATGFSMWLRWGRVAVLRRSGRVRHGLPLWRRTLQPGGHSVFLGRAHYRQGLRVPPEEHLLVMAPPRTYKTAFLADVILRYPGPVIATTTATAEQPLDYLLVKTAEVVWAAGMPGQSGLEPYLVPLRNYMRALTEKDGLSEARDFALGVLTDCVRQEEDGWPDQPGDGKRGPCGSGTPAHMPARA